MLIVLSISDWSDTWTGCDEAGDTFFPCRVCAILNSLGPMGAPKRFEDKAERRGCRSEHYRINGVGAGPSCSRYQTVVGVLDPL